MNKRALIWIAMILVIQSNSLFAQVLQLAEDINKESISASPEVILGKGVVLEGSYFYAFNDGVHGLELWVTDGTDPGTRMIKDIAPGFEGSNPVNFVVHDNHIYFSANDLIHGPELWRATATSAELVKDLHKGLPASSPANFFSFDDKLIFSATTADGLQTMVLANGNVASLSPATILYFEFLYNMIRIGDVMYFCGFNTASMTYGLWQTDGTPSGTYSIKEFSSSAVPLYFIELNGSLIFTLSDQTTGMELWKSDGTESGTAIVHGMEPGFQYYEGHQVAKAGDNIYIAGYGFIWKTDGSVAGTSRLEFFGTYPSIHNLSSFQDNLYFVSDNKFIKSDGTIAGTNVVIELNMAPVEWFYSTALSDRIIFTRQTSEFGHELWSTDGTDSYMIKDIRSGVEGAKIHSLVPFEDKVFFFANDGENGYTAWSTDATSEGTHRLKKVEAPTTFSSSPGNFEIAGDRLIFTANDGMHGFEPYTLEAGTNTVESMGDIAPGLANAMSFLSYEGYFYNKNKPNGFSIGDDYYLFASEGYPGRSLFKVTSDGGLEKVTDAGTTALSYVSFIKAGNHVFFIGDDPVNGRELWVTDGTATGTHIVKDITPGQSSVFLNGWDWELAPDGVLYFSMGYEDDQGLWRSDGTEAGTYQVKDSNPTGKDGIDDMIFYDGHLFFAAASETGNVELWRSDGTPGGTSLFLEINQGSYQGSTGSYPFDFTIFKDQLFFIASHAAFGREVWVSDGTQLGTKLLKDIRPSSLSSISYFSYFTSYKDQLYFVANDEIHGTELWRSDGTPEGTVLFKDVAPGETSSEPKEMIVRKNTLIFVASDGTAKPTLWASKGDADKTATVYLDVEIGEIHPLMSIEFDNKVYLGAQGRGVGMELYSISELRFSQTIELSTVDTKTYGDLPFTLTATASTGLPVTLQSSNPSVIKIENDQLVIVGAGQVNITATQIGNEDYTPTENSLMIVVNKKSQALTFEEVPAKTFGNTPFTLTANSTSTLPVTFVSSAPDLLSIEGSSASIKGAGSVQITASQPGNSNFLAAESVTRAVEISKGTQSITFNELVSRTYGDQSFALAATSSASLPITFTSLSNSISINGNAVTIGGAGTTEITASQAGNSNYLPAESIKRTLTINKAAQSIIFAALEDKKEDDKPFDLIASTSSGLDVSFVSSNPAVASVNGKVVTIHNSGETTLTASQTGNTNYLAAESVARTLNVLLITGVETREVGVYPNPVQNELIIRVSNPSATDNIRTFDNQGKLVALTYEKLDEHTVSVDFSTTLPGIYLVKVGRQTVKISKR